VSATNVARAGKRQGKHLCRQQCVCNNVSSFARALKPRIGSFYDQNLEFNSLNVKE